MTSPNVTNLDTITRSERLALLALVKLIKFDDRLKSDWAQICCDKFNMGRATAECVTKRLVEQANAMVL